MKHKLFSILTALALCLSLLPATAFAAEPTTVSDLNGLKQALSDANDGGTVSVQLDRNITDTSGTQLELTNGSLTLDLNGQTLSASSSGGQTGKDGLFRVNGGSFTVVDSSGTGTGTLKGLGEKGPAITMEAGSVTIEGGTVTAEALYTIYPIGGSLEIIDGTVSNTYTYGSAIWAAGSSTVTLSGGTFSRETDIGNAIFLDNGQKLSDLLKYDESTGGHLAYEKDGSVVTEGLDGKTLKGPVTVAQCDGTTVENATNNNDGTHTGTCTICKRELTESHAWENGSCVCGAKLGTVTDPWPCGDNLTAWLSADKTTLTIEGTGAMADYDVSGNKSPWYGSSSGINQVVLPKGLTTIGEYAFYDTNLKEVTIPKGVTTIGANAFQGSNLREVTIPDSVTEIGFSAFLSAASLTSVTIPAGVTKIGGIAFQSCKNLETVTFKGETPPNITGFGASGSFRDCAKLTTINVPHGCAEAYKAALKDTGVSNLDSSVIEPEGAGHNWHEDGSCACGVQAVAKVEKAGVDTSFVETAEQLAEAFGFNNGTPDAVFTLLNDVTRTETLKIMVRCTLDLNGHTIRNTNGHCISIDNTAVTIRGEGEINAGERGCALNVSGTAVLEGGTFTSRGGSEFPCVFVDGSLSVTGDDVVIECTSSDGYGLFVRGENLFYLRGGTYSGGGAAIEIFDSDKTLADLLGHDGDTRYAYFSGDTPIALQSGGKELLGTVTVKPCTHEGIKETPNGNDKHSVKCPYCGHTGTEEPCTYGTEYSFDADSHWKTCTVCGGKKTERHDFGISGSENCECGAKPPLDLSASEDSTGTGYKWEAVKDSSGKITSGTLTLEEGFNETTVILPAIDGTTVTIVTNGASTIGTLTTDARKANVSPNIRLTFSGKGTLTLQKQLGLDGNYSDLTISQDAHVIAQEGIKSGDAGGHSSITVNGFLEAKSYNDGEFDNPALYIGKVTVGNTGILEVSGVEGVQLNGEGDILESVTNMFAVTGNGRFTANCSKYNVRVAINSERFPAGATAEGAINLSDEYMPDNCKPQFHEGIIYLWNTKINDVYSGALTIHKNHKWEARWTWDDTTHWHACEFPGCTEKQPGSEAAHFYRNCACTICPYQAPAGTPDSGGGGGGDRPVHTHTWAAEWSSDSTRHWHACRGCSQRKDLAEHVYDDEWDANCNICGYVREVAHRHIWAEAWSRDETSHWHECTAPDCDITDNSLKDGYEPHVYDDEWDAGCNTCGYVREVAHRHIWAEAWSSDETSHWHECTAPDCDITDNSLKDGYEPHVYDGGWDADCNTCGHVREVDYPPVTPGRPTQPDRPSTGGGSSVSSYKVTVEPSAHGNVTSNRAWATEGGSVTLTVTPDAGYELNVLTVTDSRGDAVELTGRGGGYTFTMPGRPVTVSASFRTLRTEWTNPYTDVRPGAWYYDAVRFVTENDLMDGFGKGVFGPNSTLTRAQFVQILFNREGRPAVNYLLRYNDLTPGAWYTEAVRWAASQGVVSGVGGGRFAPNDPITREQLAATLWRYAGSPAAAGQLSRFNDAGEISGYAREAMSWAVENGILQGSGGRLSPRGQATRGEAAQMLKNFIENTDWSAARGV